MLLQILLAISIVANLRAFYLLGRQYKFKSKTNEECVRCQGGRKHLYEEIEKNEVSLEPENKMLDKDK